MNFKYLPGLEWDWGFFAVLGAMAAISVGNAGAFSLEKMACS